jgi:hypothetical protein
MRLGTAKSTMGNEEEVFYVDRWCPLMIKGIFKLPLRALQGFLDSIFTLMDVPLKSPSYSCISKRAKTVEVQYRLLSRGSEVIDAKRRVWRQLDLAIDSSTHEVISAVVSLESACDNEALPTLLNSLRRKILQVSADEAYDTKACHQVLRNNA